MNCNRLIVTIASIALLLSTLGCGSRNRCCGPKPSCAPPMSGACCPTPGAGQIPPPPLPSPSGMSGF